jgi:hypothetical protein
VLAALLACKASAGTGDDLRAKVSCEGTAETVDCDVAHASGSSGANVCWDLEFKCQNGTVVTGSGFCQPVQPQATAQKRIPLTQLANSASCDKALSSEVKNLKITAL